MVIPALSQAANATGGKAGPQQAISDAREPPLTIPPVASLAPVLELAYAEFAAALKDALRNFHSPDLLAQNPLVRHGIGNLGPPARPLDLKALLLETASTLFGNPRDEKLRRVIELTYFQPSLKQEAVADRLSLSFGTYRRYLTTARDRLAHWLWENRRAVQPGLEPPPTVNITANGEASKSETATSLDLGVSRAPRLSLVVLPFVNFGGSAQDDRLVDGITETLTTDLSRGSGVFVISRSTAFAYKGKPIDTRQIGRELGVRYVLEGSVQNGGDRMRINVQLVDSESGAHLWVERFDKQCADVFKIQDEVATRLARTIHIELIAAESRRAAREHPDRLDSVDHALHGWAAWNQHLSVDAARKARRFFEAALRLDENNFDALLGLADTHMSEVNMYASDDRAGQIRSAEAAARKALVLMPDSAEAHVIYGTVLYAMCAPERALREFKLAISLDGNLAIAHAYLGLTKFFLGRAGETRAHVEEAMRRFRDGNRVAVCQIKCPKPGGIVSTNRLSVSFQEPRS